MFYKNNLKIIPRNLGDYLTPLALATWYLNDGSFSKGSKVVSIFQLSRKDLEYLCEILKSKYNIDTIIQSGGKDRETLYIKSSSYAPQRRAQVTFSKIVKPYILPSLYYKLNGRHNKLTL